MRNSLLLANEAYTYIGLRFVDTYYQDPFAG